jgi:hypothetical protein
MRASCRGTNSPSIQAMHREKALEPCSSSYLRVLCAASTFSTVAIVNDRGSVVKCGVWKGQLRWSDQVHEYVVEESASML